MAPIAVDSSNSANGTHSKLDFTVFKNTINGKLTSTKVTRHGINPATLEALPEAPVSTREDVDAAVSAAQAAFKQWKKTTWEERGKALSTFADLISEHKDEFIKLLTTEQGKPFAMASIEINVAIGNLKVYAETRLEEETITEDDEKKTILRYTPLGVSVGIVPWNFPFILAIDKLGPSIMTGNPMIIKPSPFTPYCGLKLVELAQRAFPPGVLQVLSGDDNLGPWLVEHPGPAKISFTGSTATGKKVMESASKTLKRVTLELGGNDPAIVCADVDIPTVAAKVSTVAFLNSGQICLAIKRIYVHESIYDDFLAASVAHTRNLRLGNGADEGVFLGPVQNSMQFDRVQGFFSDVEAQKMKVAVGGPSDWPKNGYYITPTIIDSPADNSKIVTEEPFGPIVPLMKWRDEEEVVARANDTKMGLGASVWSNDLDQAARIAKQLDAGSVWVNAHFELDPKAPFGGHKESGIGHQGGIGGFKAYCNAQSLYLKKKA